jgi:ribosomal protein S18 acetylase RimI-like enzyme
MNLVNPERPVGGLAVPRPPGVEIRPLGRDDFADAIALARELYALDADADAEPLRPGYESLVNDPDATPFLAVADGHAAGLIVQRLRRRLNHATFEGWISDLVVRERFRGRGIGRALLDSTIAEWRLRGGHQMMLEVSYDRTAARALYESARFENKGKYFEIGPIQARGVTADAVEIRPIAATDADFEATTRLLAELGRPSPTDEKLPALRRTFEQHIGRADTGSMLAFLEGSPVGFISLEMRQPFFTTRPQAWIPDLVVTESARGRKVGAALLDAAFRVALRRDCYAAALESGHHRAVAHQLYLGAGMSDVGSFYTLAR